MKIITWDLEKYEQLYCPSTDEIIFSIGDEILADYAQAFIGYWLFGFISEPKIKNGVLKSNWENFKNGRLGNVDDENEKMAKLEEFLKAYEESTWIVYEITVCGMSCGPGSSNAWFVVLADSIIDESEYDEEEDEDDEEKEEENNHEAAKK